MFQNESSIARFSVRTFDDLTRVIHQQLEPHLSGPRPVEFRIGICFLDCEHALGLTATYLTEDKLRSFFVDADLSLQNLAYTSFPEPDGPPSLSYAFTLAESHGGSSGWPKRRAVHADLTICFLEGDNTDKILHYFKSLWNTYFPRVAEVVVMLLPFSSDDL